MKAERDGRVDFYRGLALVFIFWDHTPGSILGMLSMRNFGLSDAAEVFVFLAGYSAALAYGGVLRRDGWAAAAMRVLKRVWTLYVAHIFLLVLLTGIVVLASARVHGRDFVAEFNLDYFVTQTPVALVDALMLRFKPGLMDPLPLYIVLLALLVLLLPVLVRWRGAAVAASAVLYVAVPVFGWNLPGRDGEVWFFNPLAWQFLFVLGAAAASRPADAGPRRVPAPLLAGAIGVLVLGGLLALSWRIPALHDALMPAVVADLIYPVSKTDLHPLRLLHFLALALCAAALVPRGSWLDHPLSARMRLIGRHSLEVFCLGVILAPLADVVNTVAGDGIPVQVATGLAGVAMMVALARLIEWSRTLKRPAGGAATADRFPVAAAGSA
ncbi:OpgC family protein [Azospirillum halopraeferens]|uniref:OpgC family protein n=1 Tax=Azospirillum halopraeferens TaxID=34010 RepID=UPI00040E5927|nr:OpgC domain-containing protein [Azospirillum halopraeferens]